MAEELGAVLGDRARSSWRGTAWSTPASTRPAPADPAGQQAQAEANLRVAVGVLRRDEALVELAVGAAPGHRRFRAGPASMASGWMAGRTRGLRTRGSSTSRSTRQQMWKKPGEKAANRAALGAWGSYVNAVAKRYYGRPLFIACSADLAESTNIAGFAEDFGDLPGFGWYERDANPTRRAAAHRDHRVRQRRSPDRSGVGQPGG